MYSSDPNRLFTRTAVAHEHRKGAKKPTLVQRSQGVDFEPAAPDRDLFWSDRPRKRKSTTKKKAAPKKQRVKAPTKHKKTTEKAVPGSFWDRPSKKTNSWNTYIKTTCAPGYKEAKKAGSL